MPSEPTKKTRLRPLLPGHSTRCAAEAKIECALRNPRRSEARASRPDNQSHCLRSTSATKVPPRIGALHFKTMEPYRQDQLVYDPEDELDDDHHAWRQFRADVRCERTSQLLIVKKMQIPSAQMDGTEAGLLGRGITEEMLRIWNAHIRSIAPRPSASGSVMLTKAHYIAFVKLLVTRFHPNPLAPNLLRHFLNRPYLPLFDPTHPRVPHSSLSEPLKNFLLALYTQLSSSSSFLLLLLLLPIAKLSFPKILFFSILFHALFSFPYPHHILICTATEDPVDSLSTTPQKYDTPARSVCLIPRAFLSRRILPGVFYLTPERVSTDHIVALAFAWILLEEATPSPAQRTQRDSLATLLGSRKPIKTRRAHITVLEVELGMDSNHAPQVNQRAEAAERDSVGLKSHLMLSQVVGFFGLVDLPFPLSLRHHPPFSGSTNLPSSAPIVRNLVSRLSSTGYLEDGTLRKNMRIHTRYLRSGNLPSSSPSSEKSANLTASKKQSRLDHQVAAAGKAKASTHP
ncbi:hypothetical protein PCANC_07516 [Puccinia coronata f. sp. avenae]|uniref:Uncharacterized protein n=1 Tax=Puccinia coronata f. sp. avenae TaxID=200324 RepID=A0A2N5VTC7_9BASI|nr:hypothetical protein PCANC_07516 [Puccinia coronata f. sp. avenae]